MKNISLFFSYSDKESQEIAIFGRKIWFFGKALKLKEFFNGIFLEIFVALFWTIFY